MPEDTSIDYKKVGLRVGLEIHQQLKSNRKLFCHCKPCLIKEDPDIIVVRYMRPTLGETGEIDPTMLKEFKKKRYIVYQAY
ncbi:MAG: Glu-tRNA(Gln) amidotransferase GatDE subunit E, partial [Thermoprotei archaeon]